MKLTNMSSAPVRVRARKSPLGDTRRLAGPVDMDDWIGRGSASLDPAGPVVFETAGPRRQGRLVTTVPSTAVENVDDLA